MFPHKPIVSFILFSCVTAQAQSKHELNKEVFGEDENQHEDSGGTPNSGSCTCVPYFLCSGEKGGIITTYGEYIIDIRRKRETEEGQCPSYLEICCHKKKIDCGHRNPTGLSSKIKENVTNQAEYGEFPWMVAVFREEVEAVEGKPRILDVYQCGGALIHPQVVLTAAHCVSHKKHFKIRAGDWDTQTTNELHPHQDREVEFIVTHPEYYVTALRNDIALLFLKTPVDIADNVNVVCLPPQGTTFDGERCLVSGWGKDGFGTKRKYQKVLKRVYLPVVPRDKCQEKFRSTPLGKHFKLHESFICAGGEPGRDMCQGDGGSPLVCPISGEVQIYHQAGIVAWGVGCGNNMPGVYVNVALFRNWIDQQMSLEGIDTQTYEY